MRLASLSLSLGLAFLPLTFAQYATHDIEVGGPNGEFVFSPEAIYASVGDKVVFHFNPKNHTATQSSFESPCGLKPDGFNSGFMPVSADSYAPHATFTVDVQDTKPIWVFCNQARDTANSHCGKGMVFAVNCGPDGAPNSFANFKAAALAIGASLQAGATTSSAASPPPSTTWTAAYGTETIPPPPQTQEATKTITLGTSTWLTTYTSYAGAPDPTPAALEGVVHRVVVGGPAGLVFTPNRVDALPRDTIVFEFRQKNHTVTQSAFGDPCRKLTINGAAVGFDSGFFPVGDNATEFPTFNLTINDTTPIWAYCRQGNHCGQGMVFAINSDESGPRNYQAFSNLAKKLNGTVAGVGQPTSSPTSGAESLRIGGALALTLTAVIAVLL